MLLTWPALISPLHLDTLVSSGLEKAGQVTSGLALPFKAKYKDQVQSLSAIMALEGIHAVLTELPILKPREIV